MARSKLLFTVTQPSDNVTYEHVIQFIGQDVFGYENLRDVTASISIPTLIKQIHSQQSNSGSVGPYTWKWID